MRLFSSRQEWLRAIQHPKLIIIVTGARKTKLDNDLYERMFDNTPFSVPKTKRYKPANRIS